MDILKAVFTRVVNLIALCLLFFIACKGDFPANPVMEISRCPALMPDYNQITLPPNIAPLNFRIIEDGLSYYVKAYSESSDTLLVSASNGRVGFPQKKWAQLLQGNRGRQLFFEVYKKDKNGTWFRFQRIINHIANEPIDGYLVYRIIDPAYSYWNDIGIYERELSSFKETTVLNNKTIYDAVTVHKQTDPESQACINCHTFCNNSGNQIMLHMRGGPGAAMLVYANDKAVKVDTRSKLNTTPCAYASWHPGGKLIACATMNVVQFFHAVGKSRDVVDLASDIVVYDIAANTVKSTPALTSKQWMETFPEWSADGKFLYFCRAPHIDTLDSSWKTDRAGSIRKIKYDLARIAFDEKKGAWGDVEVLLSSQQTGLSISEPKASPEGRFLMFSMANYGNFHILNPESDLYLMDLRTKAWWKLPVNSEFAESYHYWSSNSRWFVFSSKRDGTVCARPYFSYIDSNGVAQKPFVLPQKDPEFYATFLKTYNLPTLINSPVKPSWRTLDGLARGERKAIND